MLNSRDQENLVKASQTAGLLVQDIRELVKSKNPLLSEITLKILQGASQAEHFLNRIESISHSE